MGKKSTDPGRPPLINEEKIEEICQYIENGNNYTNACILSMVASATFYDWKKRGLEDIEAGKKTIYSQLIEKIKAAKAKYKAWLIQSMNNTAQIDGKLALDILSRLYPKEFSKKDRIKFDGPLNIMKYDIPVSEEEKQAAIEQLNLFLKRDDE